MKPEKIIGKKYVRGKPYYKVKWDGSSKEQATWESPPSLHKYKNLINKYEIKNWGAPLDEKFFNPENYLTKGFPKKNTDKKEAKQQKKIKKKKNVSDRQSKNKDKKKYEEDSSSQNSSNEDSEEPKFNTKKTKNKDKNETSQEDTESHEEQKPRKKVKKNTSKEKKLQPSIFILDSQSDDHKSNRTITERQSQQRYEQECQPIQTRSRVKCQPQYETPKDQQPIQKQGKKMDLLQEKSSIVQIIDPKNLSKNNSNVEYQSLISDFLKNKEAQYHDIAIIESSELSPQQPKQNIPTNQQIPQKVYNLSLPKVSPQNELIYSKTAVNTIPQLTQNRIINLQTSSNQINYLIPPKLAPKITKVYHLDKISENQHLYLVEYNNGDIVKMNTSQLIQIHPQEMVSFLQRKLKMKHLCI